MQEDQLETAGTETSWTVQRVLEWTTAHLAKQGCDSPRLEAEILLASARECSRVRLYTEFHRELTEAQRSAMRRLVQRRARHEPVAYLVGHREFFSLDFAVTRDVLIPRPETETLVLELIELARRVSAPRILDVGTGSGCIAVAAAVHLPAARLTAVDVSAAAVTVARGNARRHNVSDRLTLLQGDLFQPLGGSDPFDFIVSNPPYVAEAEFETLPLDIRRYEPRRALVAGGDGLEVIRRLIVEAPRFLVPGGKLIFEFSPEQAPAVPALCASTGTFSHVDLVADSAGKDRVAIATMRE